MPFKRSFTAHQEVLSSHGGAAVFSWDRPKGGESFAMAIRLQPSYNAHLDPSKNPINPPNHFHSRQAERFEIVQGSAIFTLDGKDLLMKSQNHDVVTALPGMHHTFRADPASQEDVVLRCSAGPSDGAMSERFFRNIYSYSDDCFANKVPLNFFQVLLFLDASETYLALPGPRFLANGLSRLISFVGGRIIGGMILGYKETYDEYYDPNFHSVSN